MRLRTLPASPTPRAHYTALLREAMDDRDRTPRGARVPRLLSVVAPMCDEEATALAFYERVRVALADVPFELIVVDDGSADATAAILTELAETDPRVKLVRLSRRFGHQAALTAGLDHATGEVAVMLDGDLQDPPELIPAMLERWSAGSDVVSMVRRTRSGETRVKLASANAFYRLVARVSQTELQPNVGDFRLLDRRALDALQGLRERNRYLRGMTVWVGFTQTTLAYDRETRHAGDTKFTLRGMLRFSLDAIASFSHIPLQLATLLGFLFALIAFLGVPIAIGFRIAGQFVPGIATVVIAVLLLGGIQLIAVGLIGEYVGRIYDEVKQRPLYVVREVINMPVPAAVDHDPERLPAAPDA